MKKINMTLLVISLSFLPLSAQTLDCSFQEPQIIRPAKIGCIKIMQDGKKLIGGNISFFKTSHVNNIVRLNSDNSLDPTFSFNGKSELLIRNIEIQSNGDLIVFAQEYRSMQDVLGAGTYIYRLSPNGAIMNEIDTLLNINSVTVQNDNKIIVGGGDSQGGYLFRLKSDLTTDNSFKQNNAFNNMITCVGFFNTHAYAGGQFSIVNGNPRKNIVRLNTDGNIDNSFDPGSGTTAEWDTKLEFCS